MLFLRYYFPFIFIYSDYIFIPNYENYLHMLIHPVTTVKLVFLMYNNFSA